MNQNNYFIASFAKFKGCKPPKRNPNFTSGQSEYWYGEDKGGRYVIRSSDHWSRNSKVKNVGRIRSCFWTIDSNILYHRENDFISYDSPEFIYFQCGKCYFENFHPVKREKIHSDLRSFAIKKRAKQKRKRQYFRERFCG